jgi:Ankyrin repeats (3 copies)
MDNKLSAASNADIPISADDRNYLINIIKGCYATFESNGTFDACVCIEPYKSLTERVLGFRASWDLSDWCAEDIHRVSSWLIDKWHKLSKTQYESHVFDYIEKKQMLFEYALTSGKLLTAQWLYVCPEIWINIPINIIHGPLYNLNEVFTSVCETRHLQVLKWLYRLGADIHYNRDDAFCTACASGEFEVAKWLKSRGARIHTQEDSAFYRACGQGYIEIAKWLYKPDMAHRINSVLACACDRKHLEVAKWLYAESIMVDVNLNWHVFMRNACTMNCIEITQWLLTIIPADFDINKIFTETCRFNHMEIAKLLIAHGADVHYHDDYAFVLATAHGGLETAQWLYAEFRVCDAAFSMAMQEMTHCRKVLYCDVYQWLKTLQRE